MNPSASLFWRQFMEESERLRELVFDDDALAAHERIGELLADADYPHAYELTSDAEFAFLIFTPESDLAVARVVDSFVAAAPLIAGWRIFNRQQRKPLEDALAILENVYDVEARDLRFTMERVGDGFNITMHTALDDILGEPERDGFIAFFLEHALGEDTAMRMIKQRHIAGLDAAGDAMEPGAFVSAVCAATGHRP